MLSANDMDLLLYIFWNPDDTLLRIGSFGIRYYSLCWLAGLTGAYFMVKWLYRDQQIKESLFEPLFLYCFISILIGARLGHCLFYDPAHYLSSWDHFVEMLIPMRHMADGSWKFTGY